MRGRASRPTAHVRPVVVVALIASSVVPSVLCAQSRAPSDGLATGPHEAVVNGVRLWYEVAGGDSVARPPVVFLHGGPGQGSHHFATLSGPMLEPSLRMVYLDQRGSGRSERPWTGDYTIATQIEDLEGLRLAMGVPQMSLIAHSFGGLLALEYAARYPESVVGVVIVSGLWDTSIQCRLRLQMLAVRRPEAYARVQGDTLRADGSRRSDCDLEFLAFDSEAEREAYNNAATFPDSVTRLRLERTEAESGLRNTGEVGRALFSQGFLDYRFAKHAQVTAPVLVIAGEQDGAARPEGLRELAERLPHGSFLTYEGAGHFVYLDEPDRFAGDVIEFLASIRQ